MRVRRIAVVVLVLSIIGAACSLFAQGLGAQEPVAEAKQQIVIVPTAEAKGYLDMGGYVFIDVREPNETNMGHVPGAIMIPRGLLEFQIASKVADKNAKIAVYCKVGGRGALAAGGLPGGVSLGFRSNELPLVKSRLDMGGPFFRCGTLKPINVSPTDCGYCRRQLLCACA